MIKCAYSTHGLHHFGRTAHIREGEFGTENELEKLMIYDMKNAWCSLTEERARSCHSQIQVAVKELRERRYPVKGLRYIVELQTDCELRTFLYAEKE